LEFISRKGRLSEDLSASIMTEVIEGVKYLMKMGIIHRDIKPANILRGDKIWKIADFGFSINCKE
jgi:serine/threonine-protein kinase ULK/ATG1